MPEALPLDKLNNFIKTVPPFHLLPQGAMEELARTLVIEYFPEGNTILSPKKAPSQFLYIIRSGGVRFLLSEKDGQDGDTIYDYRDERDFFGLVSLLNGKPSPFTIVAEEDTICYLVRKKVFRKLIEEFPDIFAYFTSGPSKGLKQFDTGSLSMESLALEPGTEQVLFTGRIKDVMNTNVLTCPPDETIVGAAQRMTEREVGSVIVVDNDGVPVGILTDRDLRSKVLASGRLANLPVVDVMNRPVQSASPGSFCFEAILSMITNGIKYLPVMDGIKLVGIISERDLMVSQGNNPVAVVRGFQQAKSIDELVAIRKNIDLAMRVILEHGGMAKDICELITTLNDHLTQKLIGLAEEAMEREGYGRPPAPYAWLALGSEGRREQTLRADQDNALIFADDSLEREEKARAYFLSMAEKVVSGLERCGFPRCKGGIMSVNPKWCQPVHVWKEYFRHWIADFDYPAEEVLATFVFFDCRPIYGQHEFVTRIVGHISELLDGGNSFVREMAKTAILHKTPLGFFKRLVVEKSGEHKNKLNLKLNGLTPLVDAVRTLALGQKAFDTNTLDRISALVEKESLTSTEADDLRDAFNVIMLTRVRHHVHVLSQGGVPDNYIDPDELSIIQRTMLKEAFKAIDKLQGLLEFRFDLKA